MPLSKYFGGKGRKVMGKMKEQYGEEKGENVFYATAQKRKKSKKKKSNNPHPRGTGGMSVRY